MMPRWSVGGHRKSLPASIAGLPAPSASVGVGPPLSCRGPSRGSPLTTPVSDDPQVPVWMETVAAGWLPGDVAVAAGVSGDDIELSSSMLSVKLMPAPPLPATVRFLRASPGLVQSMCTPTPVLFATVSFVATMPALDVEAGRAVCGDRRAGDLEAGAGDAERAVVAHDVVAQGDRIALRGVEAVAGTAPDRQATNRHRRRTGDVHDRAEGPVLAPSTTAAPSRRRDRPIPLEPGRRLLERPQDARRLVHATERDERFDVVGDEPEQARLADAERGRAVRRACELAFGRPRVATGDEDESKQSHAPHDEDPIRPLPREQAAFARFARRPATRPRWASTSAAAASAACELTPVCSASSTASRA